MGIPLYGFWAWPFYGHALFARRIAVVQKNKPGWYFALKFGYVFQMLGKLAAGNAKMW